MDPLKMYFLLKMGDIPACYVSLPECNLCTMGFITHQTNI